MHLGFCSPNEGVVSWFRILSHIVHPSILFTSHIKSPHVVSIAANMLWSQPFMSQLFKKKKKKKKSAATGIKRWERYHEENYLLDLHVAPQLLNQADCKNRQGTSFVSTSVRFPVFRHLVVVCLTESWVVAWRGSRLNTRDRINRASQCKGKQISCTVLVAFLLKRCAWVQNIFNIILSKTCNKNKKKGSEPSCMNV